MANRDLINYLQEIRGTNTVGQEALPEEANGIYHDLVKKTTEDDGTTAREGEGIYGSIKAMYSRLDLIRSEIEDFEATLNGAETVIDGFQELRDELDTKSDQNHIHNLGYNSSTRTVTNSDGSDAILPEAVADGSSGLLSGSDKAKIDTIDTLFNRDLGGII